MTEPGAITVEEVASHPRIVAWILKANQQMAAIGYTEHGHRHSKIVAKTARRICLSVGMSERQAELAAIAGYLHDIGCMIHRDSHPQTGAIIALHFLDSLGMAPDECGDVAGAIGNHEEPEGAPISPIASAVIIADKSDVHRSRVQNSDPSTFDIHDRVNSAVSSSVLSVHPRAGRPGFEIRLDLQTDTSIASVTDYFEIFVSRMVMCRRAAELIAADFLLTINGYHL